MHVPTSGSLLDYLDTPTLQTLPSYPTATLRESTFDWPGRRSLSVAFSGCDLRCAYCSTPEYTSGRRTGASLGELLSSLIRRRSEIDGVVLTGGEPLAFDWLPELVSAIGALELPVKLDTSGTRPEMLAEVLATVAIGFVALDVKATPDRYDVATHGATVWRHVERSIAEVYSAGVDHEFRTTCYPFAVTLEDLPGIAARLSGGQRYVLQQFCGRRTLDPAAASAKPFSAEELKLAALRCSVHLPTVVRGV